MGAAIHHSQRRVSCDACRKTKARCQRIQPTDAQCARCFLMKIECIAGEQRRIGRPQRKTTDSAKRRNEHIAAAHDATPGTEAYGSSDISTDSSVAIAVPYSHSQTGLHSPSSPVTNIFDEINSAEADPWPQILADVDAPSTWDISWEPNLASLDSVTNSNHFDSNIAFPCPKIMVSSPLSSGVASARSLGTQYSSQLECLSELQRISFDLHIRRAAMEQHKETLNLNMMIYREGPLFINGITCANFALKASQSFVQILSRLQRTWSRAASPPTPPLAFSELNSPVLLPIPRVAYEPLSAPLALAMTSVFAQLVEMHELHVRHLSARMEIIDTAPITPIPSLTFEGVTMENPCIQGMLFTNMVLHLVERMERALGIAGGPEGSEGLLSPRQMDVLWSELGGEDGDIYAGMLRSRLLNKALVDIGIILRQVSFRRP